MGKLSVNSPHKGQWRGALVFSVIYPWIDGWVNTLEAGDLIRHRAHYDVTVMQQRLSSSPFVVWYDVLIISVHNQTEPWFWWYKSVMNPILQEIVQFWGIFINQFKWYYGNLHEFESWCMMHLLSFPDKVETIEACKLVVVRFCLWLFMVNLTDVVQGIYPQQAEWCDCLVNQHIRVWLSSLQTLVGWYQHFLKHVLW